MNAQTIALRMIFFNFKFLGSDKLVPPDILGWSIPILGVIVMFILIKVVAVVGAKLTIQAPPQKRKVTSDTMVSRARAMLQERVATVVNGLDMDALNVANDFIANVKDAVATVLAMKKGKKTRMAENEVSARS